MESFLAIADTIWFRAGIWALIAIGVGVLLYNMFFYISHYGQFALKMQTAYLKMQENERKRIEASNLQRALNGMGAKKSFMEKFDEIIVYSGLGRTRFTVRDKYNRVSVHKVTSEVYLVIVTALISAVMLVSVFVTQSGTLTLLITGGTIFGIYVLMKAVIIIRNKRIESQMLRFMNLLDNFFISSNDVTPALRHSADYLDAPLKGVLMDAVIEAEASGDTTTALANMQNSVSSKYFKQLIHNISIASLYENNYKDIIADTRSIFVDYTKTDKEKWQVKISGVMNTALILGVGLICLVLLGDVTDEPNIVWALKSGGLVGNAILIYTVVSALVVVYFGIIKTLLD